MTHETAKKTAKSLWFSPNQPTKSTMPANRKSTCLFTGFTLESLEKKYVIKSSGNEFFYLTG